jgi:hypothetical protein
MLSDVSVASRLRGKFFVPAFRINHAGKRQGVRIAKDLSRTLAINALHDEQERLHEQ